METAIIIIRWIFVVIVIAGVINVGYLVYKSKGPLWLKIFTWLVYAVIVTELIIELLKPRL